MRAWFMGLGALAGLFGAAGVALAAVGAHRSGDPIVTTAANFLLFHASGLTALCAMARPSMARPNVDRGLLVAGWLIAIGTVLFSGDLALRALADITLVHMAAPTGGTIMILGWLVAAVALTLDLSRHRGSS